MQLPELTSTACTPVHPRSGLHHTRPIAALLVRAAPRNSRLNATSALQEAEQAARLRAAAGGAPRAATTAAPYQLRDFETKLRPGALALLARLQAKFRLYIYTMGDEVYACAMASLLDPGGDLFRNRILNRADSNWAVHQKGLHKLGVPESMAVVVDDTVGAPLLSSVFCGGRRA